jgi:two-component system, NarL family, invasion response regulator UvrY
VETEKKVTPLVSIVLVDDHKLVRTLLKSYLESIIGFSVVAEAESGSDAVALVKIHRPHVCIMDITLRGLDGYEATKKILQHTKKTQVLAISASTRPESIRRMVEAGAKGYLFKDCEPETLCAAVRAVAAGLSFYQPEIAGPDARNDRKRAIFSKREAQVVRLLLEDYTLTEIGKELGLAYSTIFTIKGRICMKTGSRTLSELIKYAINHDTGGQ